LKLDRNELCRWEKEVHIRQRASFCITQVRDDTGSTRLLRMERGTRFKREQGGGSSLAAEHLPSRCKALGLGPSTKKKKYKNPNNCTL
jgi:hypothetical protein